MNTESDIQQPRRAVLTDYDKKILYQRFHALKHRAAKLGIKFGWPAGHAGLEEFIEDVVRAAPPDYTVTTYRASFSKALVKEIGYCAESLAIVKSRSETIRQPKVPRSRKNKLIGDIEVANLTTLAGNLALVLLEHEGTPDELLNLVQQNWS